MIQTHSSNFKRNSGSSRLRVACVVLILGFGLIDGSRNCVCASDTDEYLMLMDQGQYQPLVAELNAAIAKKTAKTDAADRYALLLLKGEALLHMKAREAAEDAFGAAALAGSDEKSIAIAKATVYLIKHCGSSGYQPKAKTGDAKAASPAIDIIQPTSRKEAFTACSADLLATLSPQVANAENITSLPPIVSLARQTADARNMEIAATGADAQSKDLIEKLAKRAGTLLSAALKPLDDQIKAVTKDITRRQRQIGRRAGQNLSASLSPSDEDELDSIVSQAREVSDAITQMLPLFGKAGDLKTIQSDAEKIITDANKVLTQYHHTAA